jgi:hypothetical protein
LLKKAEKTFWLATPLSWHETAEVSKRQARQAAARPYFLKKEAKNFWSF